MGLSNTHVDDGYLLTHRDANLAIRAATRRGEIQSKSDAEQWFVDYSGNKTFGIQFTVADKVWRSLERIIPEKADV